MAKLIITILMLSLFTLAIRAQIPTGFKLMELPQPPIVRQQIESKHPGWTTSLEDVKFNLKSITVFDGNPKDLASLVPDKSIKGKTENYSVWSFDPKSKREIWIKCEFSSTTVSLAKSLSPGIKELRIYYNPNIMIDGNRQIEKVLFR